MIGQDSRWQVSVTEPRLGIIVPAAGGSRRLGQPKQLLINAGESLIRRMVRLAAGLRPRQLVVVTGASHEEVSAEIDDLPARVVHHPGWESGMGSSMAAGAGALDSDLDGIMILLCDQWRIGEEELKRLQMQWRKDPARIAAARWNDTFGPPVIFPANLLSEIRALDGDRGAHAIIKRQGARTRFVEIHNAEFDLDTPDDFCVLQKEFS